MISEFAVIAPRVTGSLSAISSSLIIAVILKSPTKLNTIYHRIMFAMSSADIMSSIAMGLTTLPMPALASMAQDAYAYEGAYHGSYGRRFGNIRTCEAQGFFFIFGFTTVYAYNITLCVYYACAIAFRMKEKRIRKYVEPILHLFPIAMGLASAVPPLFRKMYNPTRTCAWCNVRALGCDGEKMQCYRGSPTVQQNASFFIIGTISAVFIIIVTSLLLVVRSVVQTEREMRFMRAVHARVFRNLKVNDAPHQETTMDNIRKEHQTTKVILVQALAYISACLVTLFFVLVSPVKSGGAIACFWCENVKLALMPLQGFFNFLIFLGHKVFNYRRTNQDASFWHVVRLQLTGAAEEPVFISRITFVKNYEAGRGEVEEIEVDDELDGCVSYGVLSAGGDERGDAFAGDDYVHDAEVGSSKGGLSFPSMSTTGDSIALSSGNDVLGHDGDSRGHLSGFDAETM